MKYLLVYFISITALASVAVPKVSAKNDRIYFPDENSPGNSVPNAGNNWNNIFWTGQPGNQGIPKPTPPQFYYPQQPPFTPPQQRDQNGNPNLGGQCVLTSLPPDPQSGCCGRHETDDDRITVNDYNPSGRTNRGPVQPPPRFFPIWGLRDMDDPNDGNDTAVNFDTRISGGEETEFYQYPWTVHLLATFGYQNKPDASFNCGGALISAKYVLSAAHCVSEPGGVLKSLTVTLAEYDKRTFPQDCKITVNGRECINNIQMFAEKIVIHSEYENRYLSNDISLIKLRGTAPYTQYIRPICLPTIDIESPNFRRPQFAVAGWGRNGEYNTNIKQATVLNLVNREVCQRSYPYLIQGHLCAAGNSGADTCKGDSGGPLMILYRGNYYVSGLVSGKRGDVNCGNNRIPSLYTNVYRYLGWIRSNMQQ